MLLRLKKAWSWICRFPKRITGVYTPLGGVSWKEDITTEPKSDDKDSQSPDPAETVGTQKLKVSCAFCTGLGRDPITLGPCQICHGLGELVIDFDNPIRCRYCTGLGRDPITLGPCQICKGIGLVRRLS